MLESDFVGFARVLFRGAAGSHLEIAECGHFAEFLERG